MRPLSAPPASLFRRPGAPELGSFAGPLPAIDWTPLMRTPLAVLREKRWVYVTLAADDVLVVLAVVSLGYATKVFSFVFDKAQRRVVARASRLLPPGVARIGTHLDAHRIVEVSFRKTSVHLVHEGDCVHVRASVGAIEVDARVNDCASPPGIGAIVDLGDGHFHATEKRTLAPWAGSVAFPDGRFAVDDGLAGFDFSSGFPLRSTAWRWAFVVGHSERGEPVALNLVEGFVREPECAVWFRGAVHGVGEGRFSFERRNLWRLWHVTSADGSVELTMIPCDLHEESIEAGVVSVRYRQPVGLFSGTIRLADETVVIRRVVGVAEEQRVRW